MVHHCWIYIRRQSWIPCSEINLAGDIVYVYGYINIRIHMHRHIQIHIHDNNYNNDNNGKTD